MSADADDELVGTILDGRYQLLSVIGQGKMGVLYKARHQLMKRLVAVKMLQREAGSDSISPARLQEEAKALSALQHGNIVGIHDFGLAANGQPYLVMDYVDGVSLAELLARKHHLDAEAAAAIFIQCCRGLAHAHENRILHRDIKPTNIMIEAVGEEKQTVKIVDFGIAKLLAGQSDNYQRLTKTGEVFGSPHYLSPEQCAGRAIDERSDIYGLGCVLYESLTGVPPISGGTPADIASRHVTQTAASFKAVAPDLNLPQALENTVFKALAKNPAQRHQSMLELAQELEKFHSPVPNVEAGRNPRTTTARPGRSPQVAATLGTVVLLALILFALSGQGRIETDKLWLAFVETTGNSLDTRQLQALDQLAIDYTKQGQLSKAVGIYEEKAKRMTDTHRENSLEYAQTLTKLVSVSTAAHADSNKYRHLTARCMDWLLGQSAVVLARHDCIRLKPYALSAYDLASVYPECKGKLLAIMYRAGWELCSANPQRARQYYEEALDFSQRHTESPLADNISLIDQISEMFCQEKQFSALAPIFQYELAKLDKPSAQLNKSALVWLDHLAFKADALAAQYPESRRAVESTLLAVESILEKHREDADELRKVRLALAAIYYKDVTSDSQNPPVAVARAYLKKIVSAYSQPDICRCPGILFYYLATLCHIQKDYSSADSVLQTGIKCARQSKRNDAAYLNAAMVEELALVYCHQHDYKQAIPLLKEAIALWQLSDRALQNREGAQYSTRKQQKLGHYRELLKETIRQAGRQ